MAIKGKYTSLLVITWVMGSLLTVCTGISREDYLDGKFGGFDQSLPELLAPVAESRVSDIQNEQVTLAWTSKIGAVRYTVQIVKDDGSDDSFTNSENDIVAGNPFTVQAPQTSLQVTLPDAFSYRWRVRSNINKKGRYSESFFHAFNDQVYLYCPAGVDECSEDTDDDGNDDTVGNKSRPFRTFAEAIAVSVRENFNVQVAQRDTDNTPYTEPVILTAGARLYGGYDASTWQKEEDTRTRITNDKKHAVSVIGINGALTRLEAFEITNSNTSSINYAIFSSANDNALTITDCIINGGGSMSYGIYNVNSAAIISNNVISGGSGGDSYGIYNLNSTSNISDNTISGGTGTKTYGVFNNFAPVQISGNAIDAGWADDISAESFGIYNSNAGPLITGNTISGGITSGNKSYGIYNDSSSPLIIGNRITGGHSFIAPHGIYNNSSPAVVIGNSVAGGISTFEHTFGVASSNSVVLVVGNIINGGSATVRSSGVFDSSATSKVTGNVVAGGPAVDSSRAVLPLFAGSNPEIENNILWAVSSPIRYGIHEWAASSASVKNNTIFDGGSGGTFALYLDQDTGTGFEFICDGGNFDTDGGVCDGTFLNTPAGVANTTDSGGGLPDIFRYHPAEIAYTQDGSDSGSGYDGGPNTIELSTCADFQQNEFFEYFFDNIPRQIENDPGATDCVIEFTPALDYDFGEAAPILLWNDNSSNYDKKYNLKTTSPSLNGGLSCPSGYLSKTYTWGSGSDQADCDSQYPFSGSVYDSGNCQTNYLHPTIEILDDSVGNDNGLCESGEDCLQNDNTGIYAGHGTLTVSPCDVSGIMENVTLLKYSDNGY